MARRASKGGYEHFYEGVGALAMGSVTYEFVLEHLEEWPYAGKPTWVLTTRDLPVPEGDDVDSASPTLRSRTSTRR